MALTDEQELITQHPGGPALVVAGAGSGKTHTICARVAALIEAGEDPESIMMLTFTKAAAREMQQRVAAAIGADAATRVVSGNFHSVANAYLRRYGYLEPNGKVVRDFEIIDTNEAEDAMRLVRSDLINATDKENDKALPKPRVMRGILSTMANRQISLAEALVRPEFDFEYTPDYDITSSLAKSYGVYKRKHKLLDYDDLIDEFCVMTQEQPHAFRDIRHVLIDEAQDMNYAQFDLLDGLMDAIGGDDVMLIGDAAQCIYVWRGSDVHSFDRFPEEHPGTTIYALSKNFRSRAQVLDVANEVLRGCNVTATTKLVPTRGKGAPVELRCCDNDFSEREYALSAIRRKAPDTRIAVLARNSMPLNMLEANLMRAGINYDVRGGGKFSDYTEIRDMLALIRLVANATTEPSLARILCLYTGLGDTTAANIIKVGLATCLDNNPYLGQRGKTADVVMRACDEIKQIKTLFATYSWTTTIERLPIFYLQMREREETQRIARQQKKTQPQREKMLEELDQNLKRWQGRLEVLQEMCKQSPSARAFLDDFKLETPRTDDADDITVTLSTIHSAKGLEWDEVVILSATDELFPGIPSALLTPEERHEEEEEERRALYVAITRARERLTILWPKETTVGKNPRQNHLSRYLQSAHTHPSVHAVDDTTDTARHSINQTPQHKWYWS